MARSMGGTGSGDSIVPSGNPLNGVTQPASMSCWVNFASLSQATQNIFYQGNAGGGNGFGLYISSSTSIIGIAQGVAVFGSFTASISTWYNVVATAISSVLTLYVNGTSAGTASGAPSASATNIGIGTDTNNTANNPLFGSIADCAMWNIGLTQLEITALAKGIRPNRIRPASLKGWWPLDGLQSPEPGFSGPNATITGTAKAFGPPFAPFTPRWPQFLAPPAAPPVFVLMPQIVT